MGNIQRFIISQRKTAILVTAAIISCICVYHIAIGFRWQQIWQGIQHANWIIFFSGTVISLIMYWLVRAFRWRILLRHEQTNIPFFDLYFYTAITSGFSTVTPFQSGEAFKVELLKRYGTERATGYAAFAVERVLDFLILVVLALIGINNEFNARLTPYILLLILASIIVITIFVNVILRLSHLQKLREWLITKWHNGALIPEISLTVISWFLVVLGWNCALKSVAINLNLVQTLALVSLSTLVTVFSFIPGGIGLSEISATQILIHFGFQQDLAQTGAILLRCYALTILILAIIHLILLRLKHYYFNKEQTFDRK